MSLYCDDGSLAEFPPPTPPVKPERGAPWRPPDTSRDVCSRCGRVCWMHRSHPPVLADEIDRAIYAAAFVDLAIRDPIRPLEDVVRHAEHVVDLHRSARRGA